ncbi:hypothetical protein E2C01_073763 [Portunus trituberculatus]|uniref:Uncharacterized protein n=1 Tax=Portunus trituberculatus TaxID=210409 RepID=A0A5B7ICI9_PORTR|nr:hypothetical protein [Portunus trituberculatus]
MRLSWQTVWRPAASAPGHASRRNCLTTKLSWQQTRH